MDEELLNEFLTESHENLSSIEEQLAELEANPENEELVNAVFRVVHTVKGSCGFLGLGRLERLAHAGENLLGRIRSLKHAVTPEQVSLLLECMDGINAILEGLEAERAEPELDHDELIARLHAAEKALQNAGEGPGDTAAEQAGAPEKVLVSDWAGEFGEEICQALSSHGLNTPAEVIDAGFARLRDMDEFDGAMALKLLGVAKKVSAEASTQPAKANAVQKADTMDAGADVAKDGQQSEKPEHGSQKQHLEETAASEDGEGSKAAAQVVAKTGHQPLAPRQAGRPASKASAGSIRVGIELLDSLMNEVGELVLTRNRLMQMLQASGSMELVRVGREIDHVTERLQLHLLQTRMQPIKNIWSGVPRVVRDVARQLGKKIRVVMEGEETELDRNILNALKDPLTHIIRNSCDHGIEKPEQRRLAGKPEEGLLRLSAAQESGQIVILIEDDGGGIDPQRVKDKAVSMGVLASEEAANMTNQQALQLIFHAGLSTAEKVSNISGRGVGMDVVRSEIEKVGGSVDIRSELGQGTTLRIRIPLTLAIINTMVVGLGGRRFALPQVSIRELINAPADSGNWRMIGDKPFFQIRGRLLPVLMLVEALSLERPEQKNDGSIVVLDQGGRLFGLWVESIYGAEEIVVKPLGVHFSHLPVYGGCSILGDGSVIPILDANALSHELMLSEFEEVASQEESDVSAVAELQHILVFEHMGRRFAMPMMLIERLEHMPAERIEVSGSGEVMQYRNGEVIPVLRWGELLKIKGKDLDWVYGLILSDGRKRLCLQVDEIVDILEVPLEIKKSSQEKFFLGTAVILGQATEIVDAYDIIRLTGDDWHGLTGANSLTVQRPKVLFAEDSPFFRNLVMPVLESMQFDIYSAKDGSEACEYLQRYSPDLVLTDLEMPNMDGYELADWAAGQEHLKQVPIVALTATPPDTNDPRRSKFALVLEKFDRPVLVEALQRVMANASRYPRNIDMVAEVCHE